MNVWRLLLGGVASGAVMWLLESLASQMYQNDMLTALRSHELALDVLGSAWFWSGIVGWGEMVLGCIVGAWIYREATPATS